MYEQDLVEELNNFDYIQFLNQKKSRKKANDQKKLTPKKVKKYGTIYKGSDTLLLMPCESSSSIQNNSNKNNNNKFIFKNSECRTAQKLKTDQKYKMVSAPQISKRSSHIENKETCLITSSENKLIFELLGERCQTLATSVIQVFCTSPPDHSTWIKKETGVLCFVKDNCKRSYFFRMYCPIRKRQIWEHEMYNNMEYKSPEPFLHTFEGKDGIVAFNFCNESEAEYFKKVVTDKIIARQKKERRMRSQGARSNISPNIQQSKSQTLGVSATWTTTSNGKSSLHPNTAHMANGGIVPQHHRSNSAGGQLKTPDKQSIIKKRTRNLTTRDISAPSDFKHVSHVGWNATKGFEVTADLAEIDEHLKKFFDIAGISEKQLNDKDTCKFIYDFLEKNGGIDAIKKDINRDSIPGPSSQPPPVPARIITQQRTAPPPPTRTIRTPAPQINNNSVLSSNRTVPNIPTKPTISVVVSSTAPNVPPPPPPLPSTTAPSAPAPPPPPPPPPPPSVTNSMLNSINNNSENNRQDIKTSSSILPAPPTDTRAALLESIRSGKKLKPVEVERKPSTGSVNTDSRSDLLNEIRQGVELKSVTPNTQKPSAPLSHENGLAGALARALAERSRAIHSDSDTSDTSSSEEDEWED